MITLLFLALSGHPVAKKPEWTFDPAKLETAMKATDHRLETVSAVFVGAPYGFSPLGEGEGFDKDPLYRTDLFDCLTFVETSMALALAKSPGEVTPTLSKIRYGGEKAAYAERNHVMEAQWVPANEKKGVIEDVTAKIAGKDVVKVTKKLDDAAWSAKTAKTLKLPKAAEARGDFSWDIVPADKALEHLKTAPDGTIVTVVRADRPTLVTRISHVGILIHVNGEPYLRHASRSYGKVVEEPLAHYLERNLEYAKWTVEGFGLYALKNP